MSAPASLNLVIHVSTDRRDGASLGLAGSRRQVDEARRKLDMLCRYRHDYLARMNDGTDAVRIAGARAFIEKLEHAIAHQQREVEACESYSNGCFHLLNAEEKKLKSLEMLRDRRLKEAGRSEHRREQKRNDESGARAARNGGTNLNYRPA
jgi:flagellar protein FliJ